MKSSRSSAGRKISQGPPTQKVTVQTHTKGNGKDEPLALSLMDRKFIEIFVRFFTMIGMPRSIGEIYGLLYSSPHPLPFDRITTRLGISAGSTSKGLRMLCELGAIRVVYKAGDRRDHYTAEIAVKMLVNGFLREKVEPHLAAGFQNIERLNEIHARSDLPHRDFYRQRIDLLVDIHQQAREYLPAMFQSME